MVVADGPNEYAEVIRTPMKEIKPLTPPKESEETLVIDGRSVPCHVRELTVPIANRECWVKTWTSDAIPGRMARHEMKVGSGEEQTSWTIVTSFEKK